MPVVHCPVPAVQYPLPTIHYPLSTIHYPPSGLPVLAFGLASPWLLAWLAAAAVPILIHLWMRQRHRETPWAAMEYLLAAIRRHAHRMRFEQWLLLAIRTLLIALLVLAVAEPFLRDATFASVAGGRTHRVLVIDGSYSMAYKPGDKSRFERAKELARQCVEGARQGDAFTLVLMSSPPRVVVGTPALEPTEILAEIDAMQLPHGTADLPATLSAVLQVVRKTGRDYPRLTRQEVYFLTDLGRVGWAPELTGSAEAEFRSRELAEEATLVVIDLGQADSQNLAVTDVRTSEPVVTLSKSASIQAKVKNFGPRACNRQRVELLVDGRSAGEAYVGEADGGLPAGGEATAAFSYRFETPGDHEVQVRLQPAAQEDALDVDNRRFLALPVKPFVRVLCVNGRPSGGPYQGATDYLRVALTPEDQQAERSPTRVEVVPESGLREVPLDRYDCVFLADVTQFVSSEAQLLQSYLKHGGGLVFFLGDQVRSESYNDELGSDRAGKTRLLPARLAAVQEAPEGRFFHFDPLGYRHPIVSAFRGREGAGLLTTPVREYFKLIVPKESKANVVLAFEGGDPAIVEEQVQRGRVVLVATSADISWTPMPLWPSYVPIVQELLTFAMGGQLQQRNFLVGQSLGGLVSTPAADVPLRVGTPDGRSEQVRLRPEGDYSSWSFAETMTSGMYTARFDAPVSHSELFAVNVDTVESDLTKLTTEQLREGLWSGIPFETSREGLDEEPVPRIGGTAAGGTTAGGRGTLSVELLYAVLGLVFLETLLAWRFGHHPT